MYTYKLKKSSIALVKFFLPIQIILFIGLFNATFGQIGNYFAPGERLNNEGDRNTFIGVSSGSLNTEGNNNSFFGYEAGTANTEGNDNSFFGFRSGERNTTGYANSFFGVYSGSLNTEGNDNSFFGVSAGASNTIGTFNSFYGMQAGTNNTTGEINSFFGGQSGLRNTTGSNNSFFGVNAGWLNTTGSNNTFVGTKSGQRNLEGNNNIFIGYEAGYFETRSNKLYIANSWTNRPLIYGDFALDNNSGRLGISINDPQEKLDVAGAIRIGDNINRTSGTIRWTGNDFEGYDGNEWHSFTQQSLPQTLSLDDTELSISRGNSIDLGALQDGVEDADADPSNELISRISLEGNELRINEGEVIRTVDLSVFTNTDSQTLSLDDTELSISGGNSIDLAVLQDGVEDADADPTNELINGMVLEDNVLRINEGENSQAVDLSVFTNTDSQTLSLDDTELSISGGNSIDLAVLQDGVEDADADPSNELISAFSLQGDELVLEEGDNTHRVGLEELLQPNGPWVETAEGDAELVAPGNIRIGLEDNPSRAKLEVVGGDVLFSADYEVVNNSLRGDYMLWNSEKGSFRAGNPRGVEWNSVNLSSIIKVKLIDWKG